MPSVGAESGTQTFTTGRALLHSVMVKAEDASLTVLCISSLKDMAVFVRDNELLFNAKVKEVVIMGGVNPPSPGEFLTPDTAHNNAFDAESARFFYQRVQE